MSRRDDFFEMLKGSPTRNLPFMPITMMFASDLIGKPYRQYATSAAVQAEGQLRVTEQFDTTHVSVISDPAVEASDHGASVMMSEDAPPAIREDQALLADKTALKKLKVIKPENGPRMANRLEAVRLLYEKAGKDRVIEGWVEGPCAESSDLRGINHLMMDLFDDAPFIENLMDMVTEQGILFALTQLEAGADIIGVGDAASSLIGPEFYEQYILPRTKKYVDAIHNAGGLVRLHICGNTDPLFPAIATLGIDMIDLDSMADIETARDVLGSRVAIAGNLNPVSALKDSTPRRICEELALCRTKAGEKYIVGAGCEVPRGTPEQNLKAMLDFSRHL